MRQCTFHKLTLSVADGYDLWIGGDEIVYVRNYLRKLVLAMVFVVTHGTWSVSALSANPTKPNILIVVAVILTCLSILTRVLPRISSIVNSHLQFLKLKTELHIIVFSTDNRLRKLGLQTACTN